MFKITVELGNRSIEFESTFFDAPPKGSNVGYSDSNRVTLSGVVEEIHQLNSNTYKVILSPEPMSREDKITYLIDGKLLQILRLGYGKTTKLWVSKQGAGVYTQTSPLNHPNLVVDGKEIPSLTIVDGKIAPEKKEEVVKFLKEVFRLSHKDAEHVIMEVGRNTDQQNSNLVG